MAEAIKAVTAATNSGVSILKTFEEKARVYYERKDVVGDNAEKLTLVLELLQLSIKASERFTADHGMNSATLNAWKLRLNASVKKLKDWQEPIRGARVTDRVRRMKLILDEAEDEVKQFLLLFWDLEKESISEQMKLCDDGSACVFRSSGYVPENPPRLTLDYESEQTAEGRLKAAILHASERFIAVVASGRGGVGKTCALRGLRSNVEIRLRFPDGVVFLSLGQDASIDTVIHQVSKIVKNTGNHNLSKKISSALHLQQAVELAREWFRARRCLFLVDDVWAANGIDGNVFYILSEMMDDQSRLVFSTRDETLAKEAETTILFEPKEPQGREARQTLLKHAGLEETAVLDEKNEDALNDILQVCGGVLLRLGAAGAGVREYTRLITGPREDALSRYNCDLKNSQTLLARQELLRYGPVRNVVDTSLHVLQKRWGKDQHEWCSLSIREMHRSLCVLKKQQVAPLSMLQRLWDLMEAGTGRVVEVMKALNDVGIVELQYLSGVEENVPQLRVHDDILEILMCDAEDNGSRDLYIQRLLGNYCASELTVPPIAKVTKTGIRKRSKLDWVCCWKSANTEEKDTGKNEGTDSASDQACEQPIKRAWWSVHDDGYILENVCSLLREANETSQVTRLLFTPQWIVKRLRVYGIFAVENDIAIGVEALNANPTDENDTMKRSLRLISEAARLSVHAVTRNPREAYFQLYGRLLHYASKCEVTKKFLDDLETAAEKPWAKPSIGFLTAAGEATRDVFRLDGRATAMAISGSAVIVCYMENDEAKVTIYDRRFGSLRTTSFGSNNQLLSMTSDGALVAVVDRDGNVSVFESKSGKLARHLRSNHSYRAVSVSLSDDGKWVACVAAHGRVFIWDAENKNEEFKDDFEFDDEGFFHEQGCQYSFCSIILDCPYSVQVNSASNRFVTSFSSGTDLLISNLVPLHVNARLYDDRDNVTCMSMSPNGNWIATASWDGSTQLCNADTGYRMPLEEIADLDGPSCISVADNATVIEGFSCGMINVWKFDISSESTNGTNQLKLCGKQMRHGASAVHSVAISADGLFACSQSADGTVRIWNMRGEFSDSDDTKEHVKNQGRKSVGANGLDAECISADARLIVVGLVDNEDNMIGGLQLWDTERGEMIHQIGSDMRSLMEPIHCVALSDDGKRVAYRSGGYPEKLGVLTFHQGTVVGGELTIEHVHDVDCVALSGNGKRVAAGGRSNCKIGVWDVESGEAMCDGLEGHEKGVQCVALSQDGGRVVSAGADKTLRVWDVQDGCPVAVLRIETPLHRLAIDAHATRVAWASKGDESQKASVRLWDVPSDSEVSARELHFGRCNIALALNSDGSRLLAVESPATSTHAPFSLSLSSVGDRGYLVDLDNNRLLMTPEHSEWDETVFAESRFRRVEAVRGRLQAEEVHRGDRLVLATPDVGTVQRCKNGFWRVSGADGAGVYFCTVQR